MWTCRFNKRCSLVVVVENNDNDDEHYIFKFIEINICNTYVYFFFILNSHYQKTEHEARGPVALTKCLAFCQIKPS